MNQAIRNCIIVLINLEFYLIYSFDLNDYLQSGKNQKILKDRNRFLKFDLVQFPVDNNPTPTPTVTETGFKNSVFKKRKFFNSNFQRKPPQTSEYVWDEIGKYWTYRSSYQSYPDLNFNGYPNSPCKPPFCLPRRCDQIDCGQSNCAMNSRLCTRNNVDCSMEQKRVLFGSEVVCISKKSIDNCVPDCGENGICIKSKCYCETGWFGDRCVILEPELCKQRKLLFCVHGCSFDRRKLDFNCICGIKETHADCVELRVCSKNCQNGGTCVQGKCQCIEGFEGNECELKINSCSPGQMGNRTCKHVCISEGKHTFQCKCRIGYQLDSDGRSCTKDECSKFGTAEIVSGKCKCKQGWEGEFCNDDVDECLFPVCQQMCVNTIGSYQCSCREGFTLLSNGKCSVNCLNYCNKNGDCLNGVCYCFSGWHGEDCSIDIDECKYNHGCEHLCVNIPGSFNCQCLPGFSLQTDRKTCISKSCKNECQNGGWCERNKCKCLRGFFGDSCEYTDFCHFFSPCEHNCTTISNNMICSCLPGYQLMPDERTCKRLECPKCIRGTCLGNKCVCPNGFGGLLCENDINECLNQTVCQHDCINTVGSFYCRCRNGDRLAGDKRSCIPQQKETCLDKDCIHGQCFNSKCVCKSGYKGKRCDEDINECIKYSEICEHSCTNTEGSYKCSCRPGYILSDNNHSCQSVCSLCQNGKCDFNNNCKCKTGWIGELCNVDVDECSLNQHKCQHNCINSNGSYSCSCNFPFYLSTLDGRSCLRNDDSCISACKNGGKCVNSKCKCKPGYTGDSCEEDINECQWPPSRHGCIGECRNTFGNYECICPPGYLVLNDQKTCEISTKDTMCKPHCLNGGVCRDMSRCYCPTGFQGLDCGTDVDECQRYAPCDKHHGICHNTYGSFYCQCSSNYVLMYDGMSCMTMKEAILKPHLRYRGRGTKGVTRIIEN